mgnify:CR=1 FL=1
MRTKVLIGKRIDIEKIRRDIAQGNISGCHFFDKGKLDDENDVLEIIIRNHAGFAYAFDIHLIGDMIKKILRVKFQWECGGWRSSNVILKRFPVMFCNSEAPTEDLLEAYGK